MTFDIASFFNLLLIVGSLAVLLPICLRGYISGRIPLGSGYETLQFLAVCIMLFAFVFRKRIFISTPFGLIFSGLVLLVSMIGSSNPQITQLMPVLISPLLSIHVSTIMISYALLGFIAFISIAAFLSIIFGKKKKLEVIDNRLMQLSVYSRILLYPAVFLLAAGIFIGAVWAEVSWGTYWSWDPKETWALITLLIYAIALHEKSIPYFRNPLFFHSYCLFAFLSVLMTYFGVNYVLGGMHSYGGDDVGMNFMLVATVLMHIYIIFPIMAWLRYGKLKIRN